MEVEAQVLEVLQRIGIRRSQAAEELEERNEQLLQVLTELQESR